MTASSSSVQDLRAAMRAALSQAMKDRDRLAAAALRSGIGAIDNAEAVPHEPPGGLDGESPVAGAVVGLGATEAARRELTVDEVHAVVRAEVEERREAATEVEGAGRPDRAEELRREADLLEAHLHTG